MTAMEEAKNLLSVKEFCELFEIGQSTYHEWQKKYGRQKAGEAGRVSNPVPDEIGQWLKSWRHSRAIDVTFRNAINYTLKIWRKLRLYTNNGILNINTMAVEPAVRPVAIGKRITCSHEDARRSGMLYGLMISCKLNGINPQVYLSDILTRWSIARKKISTWRCFSQITASQNTRP